MYCIIVLLRVHIHVISKRLYVLCNCYMDFNSCILKTNMQPAIITINGCPMLYCGYQVCRDSLGCIIEFIAMVLQFQPKIQQKFFSPYMTS